MDFWQLFLTWPWSHFLFTVWVAMGVRSIPRSFILYKVLCILTSTYLFNLVCYSFMCSFYLSPIITKVLCTCVCVVSTLYLWNMFFPPTSSSSRVQASLQNSTQMIWFCSYFLLSGLEPPCVVSIALLNVTSALPTLYESFWVSGFSVRLWVHYSFYPGTSHVNLLLLNIHINSERVV